MVIFDISSAFILGGAIALRTGGQRRDLALTAAGLGIAPAGLVFLEAFPDWDWQYLLDPSTVPPWFPALFVVMVILASLLGHWVGSRSKGAMLAAGSVFALYCLASLPRIPYVGTRAEYFADKADFFPSSFLILLSTVGGAAFAVLVSCWVLAERTRTAGLSE